MTTSTRPTPDAGEEVEVLIRFDEDCGNSGLVFAFGVEWRSWGSAPVVWRSFEPSVESVEGDFRIAGVLRFESWEVAMFEANGQSLEMTHSRFVSDMCEGWE